ncbi:MAG TPA: NADH-quinone oxidoreductase subunit NuoE [candidate division WOR-3 bacterium]|uniref:NADH-quinone oxidoreductase subunit NuoE n=1 Tax=candidate division WOR-3 bacterium TaxID=2052148 RepID=A0A7V5HMS5_UNCW3|nr:NADH-quinone oxidoreductase subunit NuoE [candidate division WOR-3 bacterium]
MKREEILKKYTPELENILFILHDLQDNNPQHYLSKEDLQAVADYLNVPYSYVHGVATFYSMFSLKPRGKYIIRVCESPACHLMGSSSVIYELAKLLGIGIGETTPDGLFTLELSSCLGVCGVAPAVMINDEVYGNLTPEKIRQIIEEKRREK